MEIMEPQVRQLYKLLGHGENGAYSDVRCIIPEGSPLEQEKEFQDRLTEFRKKNNREPDKDEFRKLHCINQSIIKGEDAVVVWARAHNGRGNCYIGRTARTAEGALKEFRTITADIDPNRERGTAASDELQGQALKAGKALLNAIRGGYCANSGNGVLVLYRLSEPVTTEFKAFEEKFKQFENEMRKHLPQGVKLDATFDTARMVKLLGTTSTKGDRASWRYSRFVDFPLIPYYRNDVLERIRACVSVAQPVGVPASFKNTVYASRSESDFALAVHYKKAGLSKEDTLAALKTHALGRNDRHDDHVRIVTKVFDEGQLQDKSIGPNSQAETAPLQYAVTGKGKLDEHKKRLYSRKGSIPEMSTGLNLIDVKTWGLRRGEIFTIAARPSIGKTSIAVSIAAKLARAGKRVLFFTSEMSTDSTYDRLLQVLSGVPGDKFNTGNFTDEDRARLDVAYEELEGFGERLAVCDSTSPNIAQVNRTATQYKPDLLIYDHIQHIGGTSESSRAKVSDFVRGLKDIARQLNCAVLTLSQIRRLYRDPKTGKEIRPTLSDLKESGTIEEESAAVMLFSILSDEPNNPVRCIYGELAKNRFGPLAIIGIEFDKLTDQWKDMESVEA